MGLFKALGEGAFAAKVVKELASRLGVSVSAIPKHQKDSILRLSTMYKGMGYSAEEAVDTLLASAGDIIIKDINNGV